jgi:photosystem II stability/assembly factor-like uncharacterized protein
MKPRALLVALLALAVSAPALTAQLTQPIDSATMSFFSWRSIGPANMSGRVTDVEGIPGPSKTFYVATAAGGIWKTINNGTTLRPLFQNERLVAMGDLAIAPSDTLQIWAGTGEEDSRNSISPGGGIYKSTDGGLTWTLMGLEDTQAIGRIVVHPTNPDIVYVAALGHIWGSNAERGLFRTTDGGDTWENVKFISDEAGFVDVAMHPEDPNTLFAASWERVRGPWSLQSGGPGSGLWKTTDGGDTWTEIVGNGFPEQMKGRIGLSISLSDPDYVYAMVEAEPTEDNPTPSGLYRSTDGGASWEQMNSTNTRPFYYSQVRVDPRDPERVYYSSTPVKFSNDGGETEGDATQGIHVDHHAMWIDPTDPDRVVVGNDGGIGISFDRGGSFVFPNTMAIGQFYAIGLGMDTPYTVCGGLQDNGTWCGPSRLASGEINNHMWATINGGDGFWAVIDPRNADVVYAESQGGNMARVDRSTGERMTIQKPQWKEVWLAWEDSILAVRGDREMDQLTNAERQRVQGFREAQVGDSTRADMRWNWNTPMILSPHDPDVFYAGGNRVVKSTNRGEDPAIISPDLTTQDAEKWAIANSSTGTTGGITRDATGAEHYTTIVALDESPLIQGMLLVGTDDGKVWLSPDDGEEWIDLTGRFPGVPDETYVSRVEPSNHDPDRFFVTFDGHRTNDFTPYVYVTEDRGETFRSISANLPTGKPDFVHVIREDPINENLLFVGTDVGVYVSTNRGGNWQRFMEGLPTTPVHDLKIHPRDRELVAGTHGRSIWIVDIAPLQELTDEVLAADLHFFTPKPGHQFASPPIGGESTGHQWFAERSAPYGAEMVYHVGQEFADRIAEAAEAGEGQAEGDRPAAAQARRRPGGGPGARGAQGPQATLEIRGEDGEVLQTLDGPLTAGLHTVRWDFRGEAPEPEPKSPAEIQDSLLSVERLNAVLDSLEAEGFPRPMLDRVGGMMLSGNRQGLFRMFGRGGGGGGPSSGWNDRPAERMQAAGAGRAEVAPGEEGTEGQPNLDFNQIRRIARAMGGGRAFGGGGQGQAPLAEPGEYQVVLKVEEDAMERTLQVTRAGEISGNSSPFFYGTLDDFIKWMERAARNRR